MAGIVSVFQKLPTISKVAIVRHFATPQNPRLLNEALRHLPSVRLISESGDDCGTMSGAQAFARAKAVGLDLLQVSSRPPGPPVLKLLNYAEMEDSRRKKAYEKRKLEKESKMIHRRESILKQVRLSPVIDTNDVAVKVRQAKQFLLDGYRVKVFMMFRRGHGAFRQNAEQTIITIAETLSKFGKVQGIPVGGAIQDIFQNRNRQSSEGDDDETDDSNDETQKKKPMEVFIYPLARKDRVKLSEEKSLTKL